MSQNPSPFSHASHNLSACNHLHKNGGYDDWVVTTAFYSGLKFLEDKLFPNDYEHPRKYGETKTYRTFRHYISDFGNLIKTNPHRIMSELVDKHIDNEEVVFSFEDLKQSCHTARYIDYRVGPDRVMLAREAIETIKNYCV